MFPQMSLFSLQDSEQRSPLHMALRNGHTAVALKLIAEHNVNIADRNGATALHIASEKGYLEVVEALLQAKAAVDAQVCGSHLLAGKD